MPSFSDRNQEDILQFTPHQIRVIKYWARLKTSAAAGKALGIKEQTVLTHLRRMRLKTGVKRTVDVYIYMLEEGLL